MQRAGAGFSGEISREGGIGSVGGFLSLISNAGRETEERVRGRYGKTNMFKVLFTERKLIHSLCLFAFTGDFNLEPLVEMSTAVDVPIATTCVLNVQRRYMRQNPQQYGWATFLYHTGIMIVSGADDLRYQLMFQCSNDNQCNPDEFKGGECDCSHPYQTGADKTEPVGGVGGTLNKGEVFDEEIIDERVMLTRPFRSDKAWIDISYTNNQGQTVTEKCGEVDIRRVGDKAPVECDFDISSLEFRCTYMFGDRGAIYFIGEPDLDEIYYLGDMIKVKGKIEKRSASSEQVEVMYVRTEIYPKDEPKTILGKEKYWPVTADGVTDLGELDDREGIPNIEVASNLFSVKPIIFSNKADSSITLTPSEVVSGDLGNRVIIRFKEDRNISKYEIIEPNKKYISDENSSGDTLTFKVKADYKEATITIRGEPLAGEIITIVPPSQQPRTLVLEVSLHYATREGRIDATPIRSKQIEFTVINERQDVAGRCKKDGTEPESKLPCDCDFDGRKDEEPPIDCDDNYKYCYAHKNENTKKCHENPRCKTGVNNTNVCDCNLDGEAECSKSYCIDEKCEDSASEEE